MEQEDGGHKAVDRGCWWAEEGGGHKEGGAEEDGGQGKLVGTEQWWAQELLGTRGLWAQDMVTGGAGHRRFVGKEVCGHRGGHRGGHRRWAGHTWLLRAFSHTKAS